MRSSRKVLGQAALAATTLTDVYTAPHGADVDGLSVVVCNRSATATTFRVAVSPAGAAIDNKHYVFYDVELPGNETFSGQVGLMLGQTDVVRVYAAGGSVSVTVCGVEHS
ncbi:MAG: hypothetical protein AB7O32_00245 [Vicinamibacterales bacterium]